MHRGAPRWWAQEALDSRLAGDSTSGYVHGGGRHLGRLILVLGGAQWQRVPMPSRAQNWAGGYFFVATAEAGDTEMAQRIANRAERPAAWRTL